MFYCIFQKCCHHPETTAANRFPIRKIPSGLSRSTTAEAVSWTCPVGVTKIASQLGGMRARETAGCAGRPKISLYIELGRVRGVARFGTCPVSCQFQSRPQRPTRTSVSLVAHTTSSCCRTPSLLHSEYMSVPFSQGNVAKVQLRLHC